MRDYVEEKEKKNRIELSKKNRIKVEKKKDKIHPNFGKLIFE